MFSEFVEGFDSVEIDHYNSCTHIRYINKNFNKHVDIYSDLITFSIWYEEEYITFYQCKHSDLDMFHLSELSLEFFQEEFLILFDKFYKLKVFL